MLTCFTSQQAKSWSSSWQNSSSEFRVKYNDGTSKKPETFLCYLSAEPWDHSLKKIRIYYFVTSHPWGVVPTKRKEGHMLFFNGNVLELRQILLVQLFHSVRSSYISVTRSTMTLQVRLFGKGSLAGSSYPPLVTIPTTKLFNLTSLLTMAYVLCKLEQRCPNILKDPKCSKAWGLSTWLEYECGDAGHSGYRMWAHIVHLLRKLCTWVSVSTPNSDIPIWEQNCFLCEFRVSSPASCTKQNYIVKTSGHLKQH